jgi:O-acetyl-ADP-ribose deacetylase (regulator of RNase III)
VGGLILNIIEQDILTCAEDIIVHQVNCQGKMGSGLAKQIKTKYPEVFKGYFYNTKTNELKNLLGTALICETDDGKYIANVYGQDKYGKSGIFTDYDALKSGLKEVHDFAKEQGKSVAIPYKIGCGLGGGNWETVSAMITEIFSDDVVCNMYKKGN